MVLALSFVTVSETIVKWKSFLSWETRTYCFRGVWFIFFNSWTNFLHRLSNLLARTSPTHDNVRQCMFVTTCKISSSTASPRSQKALYTNPGDVAAKLKEFRLSMASQTFTVGIYVTTRRYVMPRTILTYCFVNKV